MEETLISLPRKSLFKAEEVCGLTDIKIHILKVWEGEFKEISPIISASGQKLYEERDIEIILILKKLLLIDKLNTDDAKNKLHQLLPNLSKNEEVFEGGYKNKRGIVPTGAIAMKSKDESASFHEHVINANSLMAKQLLSVKRQMEELILYADQIRARYI